MQFVTLTLPNIGASELKSAIAAMLKSLVAAVRAVRRTEGLVVRALRKLECTYNPLRDDYHPHFHLVVEGDQTAQAIVRRWLARHPEASPAAQDVRPCDERSLMELFKYFTKLVVKRPDASGSRMIAPAQALDQIFLAMQGRRVYQPIGFKVEVTPTEDENAEVGDSGDTGAVKRLGERVHWEWTQQAHDWVDLSTGEVLTGYVPTELARSTHVFLNA